MSAAPSIPESIATIEAAQAGLLYERYSSKILGYCRRRLPSYEEAEDAVQHTFLNAYRSLRTGVVPHAEAAWLYTIAENVCHERRRSAWRRSRIEVVSDDGDMPDAAAASVREHDELAGLADALAELTPNQRRAILLREWQGLSYREIAAELETTEAAVETLLFRARRSLAHKLDRSEPCQPPAALAPRPPAPRMEPPERVAEGQRRLPPQRPCHNLRGHSLGLSPRLSPGVSLRLSPAVCLGLSPVTAPPSPPLPVKVVPKLP